MLAPSTDPGDSALRRPGDHDVRAVLAAEGVHSVFQPIVDLDTGAVVAYEALARGPRGPLHAPDALFAAARAQGALAELDDACRRAAFRGALAAGLLDPLTLFVNVEPEVLDSAPLDDLLALPEVADGRLRVVLEITERALATRPADLLRTVDRVRALGWSIALDDVGADALSLAFMPLLRPDVVKLDLRLVQERPGSAVAEIMNAVNAYAEESGALILAEGVENERHLVMATALGAQLGQGWLFGRPSAQQHPGRPVAALALPVPTPALARDDSPFACLPPGTVLRRSPKTLLIELSKQLEREALRLGPTCVVAATFQEARHFTPATTQRYRDLVARTGFVCALGEGLSSEPVPGLRGATLADTDPVRGEWDIAVVGPHFSAALLARDLGDRGPDAERRFEYALTYRRETVVRAAAALVSRVVPRLPVLPALRDLPDRASRPVVRPPVPASLRLAQAVASDPALLQRALGATASGVSIASLTGDDQPLVYVNDGFTRLSGFSADELLGRNCRFLQGPDTDPAVLARLRAAVAARQEFRGTMLNHRGPERTPWWNELFLSPVRDPDGQVRQYIGVQHDVTERVEAQRAAALERDRAQGYLSRIEQLAFTDPLTGLANRRRIEERVEVALWSARADDSTVALLFLDLDAFKPVNDRLGHAAGDQLLVQTAERLRVRLRRSDLVARLGGDEFLVALPGLERSGGPLEAQRVAQQLAELVARPVQLGDEQVSVGVSIGVSLFPHDGDTFGSLLHVADQRMYAGKGDRRAAAAAPVA